MRKKGLRTEEHILIQALLIIVVLGKRGRQAHTQLFCKAATATPHKSFSFSIKFQPELVTHLHRV